MINTSKYNIKIADKLNFLSNNENWWHEFLVI